MTVNRTLSTTFNEAINQQESAEFALVFLDIRHPSLGDVIRVVSNSQNIDINGKLYQAFQFDIKILSDTEQTAKSQITVQNVDRVIGQALLDAVNPPVVDLTIYSSARFDESVVPHTAIDNPPQFEYQALNLFLTETTIDGNSVTGTLRSWDYMQESYPGIRATEENCPGLFW